MDKVPTKYLRSVFIGSRKVLRSCDLSAHSITLSHKSQEDQSEICTLDFVDLRPYNLEVCNTNVMELLTRQRYRITLDLDVLGDFDPRNLDWYELLDLSGSEEVRATVEDFDADAIYYV
mgnify:FL=1